MTRPDELELFDFLSRQHKLREWLDDRRDAALKVLVQSADIEQLRKAQGQVGIIDSMLRLMDEAPAALKRQ